jgi:Asp-tRNA(Asn)/Glu-tRNA(Gln) amidotransferase A subunit family amidase
VLHGAWHDPACWDELAAELRTRGHEVIAPELPLHDPRAGWAERIQPALDALGALAGRVQAVHLGAQSRRRRRRLSDMQRRYIVAVPFEPGDWRSRQLRRTGQRS